MSYIGHVYPAVFQLGIGGFMLFASLRGKGYTEDKKYATNGGSSFLWYLGTALMSVTLVSIIIEAAGGFITFGDVLFQIAHQSIHFGFFTAGAVAMLESYMRVPFDSWRLFFGLALCIEGVVFYGHQLEQKAPESTMHLVMAYMNFITGLAFFAAVYFPNNVMPHAVGIIGVIAEGLWLICIGKIVYSGSFGKNGKDFMVADAYMGAAMITLLVVVVVSACYNRSFKKRIIEGEFSFLHEQEHIVDASVHVDIKQQQQQQQQQEEPQLDPKP